MHTLNIMYIYLHAHIHKHAHMCTHTQTYTHTHGYIHRYARTRTHTHAHTRVHAYTQIHTHTNTHTNTCTSIHKHKHVHVHAQTHTHTHAHTQTTTTSIITKVQCKALEHLDNYIQGNIIFQCINIYSQPTNNSTHITCSTTITTTRRCLLLPLQVCDFELYTTSFTSWSIFFFNISFNASLSVLCNDTQ